MSAAATPGSRGPRTWMACWTVASFSQTDNGASTARSESYERKVETWMDGRGGGNGEVLCGSV